VRRTTPKRWIPKQWTFKSKAVAQNFEGHVREQLPWYDLATSAVEHIARHYVPPHGLVYDIGASTGNVGRALAPLLAERKARLVGIEESPQMARFYSAPGELKIANALTFPFESFDFAVLFLVLMFIPVKHRQQLILDLHAKLLPGGALVIVDKIHTPSGYAGTCLRRMAMKWKLESGTPEAEIVQKELSLAGYQRPVNPEWFPSAVQWFQFGEFAGWLVEKHQ